MSRKSPDRRPPCNRATIDTKVNWFGGCAQPNSAHYNESHSVWTNVTKLLISGSAVDPQKTGHILTPEEVDVVPTEHRVQNGLYYNSYSQSNDVETLPTCSKVIGFKRVVGAKKWQGKLPFSSNTTSYPASIDWCCACGVYPEKTTYDTTKALSMVGSHTLYREASGTPNRTTYANATAHLDRYSGQLTVTCDSGSNEADSGSFAQSVLNDLIAAGGWDITTVLGTYCASAGGILTPADVEGNATDGWTLTYDNGTDITAIVSINLPAHIVQIKSYGNTADSPAFIWGQVAQIDITIGDWTINYDLWSEVSGASEINRAYQEVHLDISMFNGYTSTEARQDLYDLLAQFDLGDDEALPWRTDGNVTYGTLVTRAEDTNAVLTLNCASGSADPKYDGSILGGPLPVGYNEFWDPTHAEWEIVESGICQVKQIKQYGAWIPHGKQWTTNWLATQIPDGAFIGSNFLWTTPSTCNTEQYIIDDVLYAAKHAEILIEKPSIDFFRPAGLDRLQLSGSHNCVITASSGVLTLEPTQQPTNLVTNDVAWVCGLDPVNIDGMWRVTRLSDYSIQLNTRMATASYFPTQSVTDCGTGMIGKLKWSGMPGINGRVDITEIDATNSAFVTCSLLEPTFLIKGDLIRVSGSKTFNLDNSTWTVTETLDNQHVVLNAPSLGRSSSVYDGQAQMYSNGAPHWKWSDNAPKYDYVTKNYDVEMRSIFEYARLLGAYSASLINYDCQAYFDPLIVDNFCNNVPIPTYPRATQVAHEMQQEIRNLDVATHCLGFNACQPSVVYWSPNEEALLKAKYNVRNHGFGESYGAGIIDPAFPRIWNGITQQYIHDPFWQSPACPCSYDEDIESWDCHCQWLEDQLFCSENQEADEDLGIPCKKYFAYRPQVEPRTDIPNGAPTFIQHLLGCKTTANPGNGRPLCVRPDNTGHLNYQSFTSILNQTPYHILYLQKQQCICTGGQFANDYRSQRISCGDEEDI